MAAYLCLRGWQVDRQTAHGGLTISKGPRWLHIEPDGKPSIQQDYSKARTNRIYSTQQEAELALKYRFPLDHVSRTDLKKLANFLYFGWEISFIGKNEIVLMRGTDLRKTKIFTLTPR
ncbi:hypothetical protein ACI2KR_08220 [Pseudomonas luteola]